MTDRSQPPWETISPLLSEGRLATIGAIITQARNAKLEQRCPPDGPWNLGCDCFQWICWGIRQASKEACMDWLHVPVAEHDLAFLFQIGGEHGIPIRLYHERSHGQPARSLRVTFPELAAQQLALGLDQGLQVDRVLRLAVSTQEDGRVEKIALVQYDLQQNVVYDWPIPTDGRGGTKVLLFEEVASEEGVQLGEPEVVTREDLAAFDKRKRERDKEKGA